MKIHIQIHKPVGNIRRKDVMKKVKKKELKQHLRRRRNEKINPN